jgi:D-glycero-D-manno-heptose 1,7-bisphosphate phosphatase
MRAGADEAARGDAERQPSRPAVFLDRDGTLVEEVPYLHDPGRVVLLGGVAALGRLAEAGYALVVVTNQAGVARGLYDEAAVDAVHRRLAELLAGAGVRLDAVLHCPHHPDGTVPGYAGACRCRKPGPGMLEAAAERLGLDLGASWLVGNHPADVGAALAAGVRPLFVTTGRAAGLPPPPGVAAVADLEAAARAVLEGSATAPAGMRGQARSGRDGAGLAWDAGWSRATAPLTGTASGRSGPPRIPPSPQPSAAVPVPLPVPAGSSCCLRRYLCEGRAERSRRGGAPSVLWVTASW